MFTLTFYTQDAAQIDWLFRGSGLFRHKWDEKHGTKTYGQMTEELSIGISAAPMAAMDTYAV